MAVCRCGAGLCAGWLVPGAQRQHEEAVPPAPQELHRGHRGLNGGQRMARGHRPLPHDAGPAGRSCYPKQHQYNRPHTQPSNRSYSCWTIWSPGVRAMRRGHVEPLGPGQAGPSSTTTTSATRTRSHTVPAATFQNSAELWWMRLPRWPQRWKPRPAHVASVYFDQGHRQIAQIPLAAAGRHARTGRTLAGSPVGV